MADTTTAQMRIMLQGYEQQLLAARRLARFRVRRRLAEGWSRGTPTRPSNAAPMWKKWRRNCLTA